MTWLSGLFNPQSFLTAIMQVSFSRESIEMENVEKLELAVYWHEKPIFVWIGYFSEADTIYFRCVYWRHQDIGNMLASGGDCCF